MTDTRSANDGLLQALGGLSRQAWLARVEEIAEEDGYFQPLGAHHSAIFLDRSPSVLVVSFEELDQVRLASPGGAPVGFPLAARRDWSHLCILAHGETWYRDRAVYGYFDRLVDEGFFEDFDRVVFYGSEMGGYGATAFSVAAPGATTLAIQPFATLNPRRVSWDRRFPAARRLDFESRYGYAPRMVEGNGQTYIVYDPQQPFDAIHASLFDREPAEHLPCPHQGNRIEAEFEHMGLLQQLLEMAGEGRLNHQSFYRAYRRRHESVSYLKHLLEALEDSDRPYLAARLCQVALQKINRRRFHEGLRDAQAKLAERGLPMPRPPALSAG